MLQNAGGTATSRPPPRPPPRPRAGQAVLNAVRGEVGVAEQPPGSNDSPRIAQFRQATAGSGVGPWCAYFTSWAAREAGVPLGDSGQGFGRVDDVYAWAQRAGKAIPNGPGVTAAARRPDRLGRAHRRRRVRRRRRHDQHDRGQLLRPGLRVARTRPARAPRSATSASASYAPSYDGGPETEENCGSSRSRASTTSVSSAARGRPADRGAHARAARRQARLPAREARRARAVGAGSGRRAAVSVARLRVAPASSPRARVAASERSLFVRRQAGRRRD